MSICKTNNIKSLYISAAHKSSGKTIVSLGLSRILANLNHKVQTFKKGPDYIDMSWLALSSRNQCYNLDFNTQTKKEIIDCYNSNKTKINLIEGNKGLYDGLDLKGSDDNSAMSILTKSNVVLVIDTQGITRGIAPLLQGYINFETKCNIQGIILNKVNNERHENKLVNAVKNYTDLKILGSVRKNKELVISERHLGLIPANEQKLANKNIDQISKIINESIDKNEFLKIGINFKEKKTKRILSNSIKVNKKNAIRVGVFYDKSFGFYYADDLDNFKNFGAEIVYIDSEKDINLKNVDAIFIGGGFPEVNAKNIIDNRKLMLEIKNFVENNGPVYAECGGLMYLAKSIKYKNKTYKMAGIIPGTVKMNEKPIGRGYVKLKVKKNHLWGMKENVLLNAHEFHHASLIYEKNYKYKHIYNMKRGYGINGNDDGFVYKNLLANFAHLRHTKKSPWIKYFINFIKENCND